jgi:hypothetical protein
MLDSDCKTNVRIGTRRKKLSGAITMTTMAALLLLASTIVVAMDPAQQLAYASVETFDKKRK